MAGLSLKSENGGKAHNMRDDQLLFMCLACIFRICMSRILQVKSARLSHGLVCTSTQLVQLLQMVGIVVVHGVDFNRGNFK